MENSTKYPIIKKIYAKSQDFDVQKAYLTNKEARQFANQGFVVALINIMGTNKHSKAHDDVCYKNLKDANFPDRSLGALLDGS